MILKRKILNKKNWFVRIYKPKGLTICSICDCSYAVINTELMKVRRSICKECNICHNIRMKYCLINDFNCNCFSYVPEK